MNSIELHPARCAICGTLQNAVELYPANFSSSDLSAEKFSARRLPDRIHFRIVRCRTCGLVRSDPVCAPQVLAELYGKSAFTYGDEVPALRATYGRCLRKLAAEGLVKGRLLEIGCGSGFFLEEAMAQGFADVRGVEPSAAAVEAAAPVLRGRIVRDVMRAGLFDGESFDLVCMFQVLDHLPDPGALLGECRRVLKPDGLLLCLSHNVDAWSARVLGDRSPIYDVEHTYLFSPATIRRLFSGVGFEVRFVRSIVNRYRLRYVLRLIPLPARLKDALLGLAADTGLGRLPLAVPLGNLWAVGARGRS